VAALVLSGWVVAPAPARADTPSTVVSLTFDDGSEDQFVNARPLLRAHGMPATFYVISGRVDSDANAMTSAQLRTLAADGDEIAGHTVTHPNLPTLSSDDQQREICNGRVSLMNMGLDVTDFAYPFGAFDATTERLAGACGYNSARGVGGLVTPGSCAGCPNAESSPAADPYDVRTSDSVKTTTTLSQLEGYVTQAQQNGGGWVPVVFHHVCDDCDPAYAVSPSLLAAFLDWLQTQRPLGTTVATVASVVGGPVQPPVPGPPPPPAPTAVQNPSLESVDAKGVPGCFQLGGYGTNSYTFAATTDAHTGAVAERLDVTSVTSGDRKLVTRQDAGICAPAVTPGRSYRVSLWYRGSWPSGSATKISVYYRDATTGSWTYWTSSPAFPPGAAWAQAAYTTPPMPADAAEISFGLALPVAGTMTVDDFAYAPV
jgi:peptidoglycan/xylan/chitin deacetylase (PgdA/CDA1 family)